MSFRSLAVYRTMIQTELFMPVRYATWIYDCSLVFRGKLRDGRLLRGLRPTPGNQSKTSLRIN